MKETNRRSARTVKRILTALVLIVVMAFGSVSVPAATKTAKALGTKASVKAGYYVLTTKLAPTRPLTIAGSSKKNKANAVIYRNQNKASQVFYIKSAGNGLYTIRNKNSGKYLEVANGTSKKQTNVRQNKKVSKLRWKWYIIKTKSGYVIQSSYTKYVLTVQNARNANNANVYVNTYNKRPSQYWTLTPWSESTSADSGTTSLNTSSSKVTENAASSTVSENKTAAESKDKDDNARNYASETINGQKTLKTYLQNAMVPVGRTLYIWGGGWSDEDASVIGYQSEWYSFFNKHANASYNYKKYRYRYGKGLDCSGFAAWTLYNTLYTKSGGAWLVWQSTSVASKYHSKGWAKLSTNYRKDQNFHPGDVVSMNGHVWISLGECGDGSVLLVHSSPRGVQISGTAGKAASLARYYMTKYFPEWPYEARTVSSSYLHYVGKASWRTSGSRAVLKDPEGIQKMSAEECMQAILGS